jgi:hypothetical protein
MNMPRPAMNFDDIGQVLARALVNAEFRRQLLSDPKTLLAHEAKGPGPAAIKFFKSLQNDSFDQAATNYRADALGVAADMET